MSDYTDITNGFGIGEAAAKLSPVASEVNTNMAAASDALEANPDDPAALANFNAAVSEWSIVMNLVASLQKSLKDVMSSIVSKM